jgi:hypothetical protein
VAERICTTTSFLSICLALGIASCGAHSTAAARAVAAPATAKAADASPPRSYRVVDATDPFWKFWDRFRDATPEQRLHGFRTLVIAENPSLFVDSVIGRDPLDPNELESRLPEWLASLDGRVDAMRGLHESVERDLERFDASFRRAFPDMSWGGSVYFTVSIDAFDGALRRVDGQPSLLFGIDKIERLYGKNANLAALFHHELFHLHHQALCAMPEPTPEGPNGLAAPLWTEGLAVYVAHHLNPGASLAELTLSEEMVTAADARMPALARELLGLLDDAREEDYRDFFLGAGKRDDLPKRVAYYVGYRVAASLAKQMPFEQLVRLCGSELRRAIELELRRMAGASLHQGLLGSAGTFGARFGPTPHAELPG